MKQQLIILTLLLFLAPTITDQLNSDFAEGTNTNINISNNQLRITGSPGNYAATAEYISQEHDLGSNPTATISWSATNPANTTLLLSTRTRETNTSSWSTYTTSINPAGSTINPLQRYVQYRLQLTSTDAQNTPVIDAITIVYTEQGADIQPQTNLNANLDQETTGSYSFHTTIQDTVELTQTQGRHRIGSDAYTTYQALNHVVNDTYRLVIPAPTGNWVARRGELLHIQIQATNENNITNQETYSILIQEINTPPTITAVADQQATEGEELVLSVLANDADADTLNYTATHGTITKITNTVADWSWTPQASNIGLTNVTITVTDGIDSANTTFSVNTTPSPKAPVIREISDVTAYYGERIIIDIIVDDENEEENITYQISPNIPITPIQTNQSNTYIGRMNFSAFDDYKGQTTIHVTVTDKDGLTDTTNFTLTINYCGDGICQANENADTCPTDCAGTQRNNYLAVQFPDRICTNTTLTITTHNASSRYECFLDKRTTPTAAAWCEELPGAEIIFYRLNGEVRTQQATATTDNQGQATFTAEEEGRYRLVAEADEHVGVTETFIARDCSEDITDQRRTIQTQRPNLQAGTMQPVLPRPERPDITEEQRNILAITIWFVLLPLLIATMIYTTTEYYALYKDTDPTLLKIQIFLYEKKQQLKPYIEPIQEKLRPALNWLQQTIIQPLQEQVIQPIKQKIQRK
ncbi:MAG: Ig-like domain-containing protein [Candidatus Woesearchaeota archaeon]